MAQVQFPFENNIARYTAISSVSVVRGAWVLLTVFGCCYQMLYKNRKNEQLVCGDIVLHVPLGAKISDHEQIRLLNIAWHCKDGIVVSRTMSNVTSMGAISRYKCLEFANKERKNEHFAETAPLEYSVSLGGDCPRETIPACLLVDLLQNPNLLKTLLNLRVQIQILPHEWLNKESHAIFFVEYVNTALQCDRLKVSKLLCGSEEYVYDASIVRANENNEFLQQHLSAAHLMQVAEEKNWRLLPLATQAIETLARFGHRRFELHSNPVLIGSILLQIASEENQDSIGLFIRPFDVYDNALLLENCPYMREHIGAFVFAR